VLLRRTEAEGSGRRHDQGQTICFSKSIQMHDIVIGLFVNRYAFELLV
jgi:hypothetical protein